METRTDRTTGELDAGNDRRSLRRERRRERWNGACSGSISGGVFLIGLGMLVLTGWWWPGILLVIGLAVAAELVRRGEFAAAASAFVCFTLIPLGLAFIHAITIPWLPVGAFVLIGLGLVALARRGGGG